MSSRKTIAERVRTWAQGRPQTELAEEAQERGFKISARTMGYVLAGHIPRDEVILALAELAGQSESRGEWLLQAQVERAAHDGLGEHWEDEALLEILGSSPLSSTPPSWLDGAEEDELLQLMRGLSREEKKRIVAIVRAALGKP